GRESAPPRACDPDADDLYCSVASLHILAPCHRKPAMDEASDHVAIEPMGEHEEFLSGALRVTGEQLQRLALLRAEAMLSRGRWHPEQNLSLPPPHPFITLFERWPGYATGNTSHPTVASFQLGCCNIAPRRPHTEHLACVRSMSDDVSAPQRIT